MTDQPSYVSAAQPHYPVAYAPRWAADHHPWVQVTDPVGGYRYSRREVVTTSQCHPTTTRPGGSNRHERAHRAGTPQPPSQAIEESVMLQRQTCVIAACDLCGDGPGDPSMELHYPSEDAALDALAVQGWDIAAAAGGRQVCPDCATVLACEQAGHEFTDWRRCGCGQLLAAHRRGTAGRCGSAFRYCQRCCLHESQPAPDDEVAGDGRVVA